MINLLPPKEKEFLLQERQWKIILILGSLLLFFLLFLGLTLFLVRIHVSSRVQLQKSALLSQEKGLEDSASRSLKQEVSLLNQNLVKLDSFFEDQIGLSPFFEEISSLLPSGIYLTSLSYQREEQKISLTGFSPNRELLFQLKNNLEKKEGLKELYFPPSNWLKPENIEFRLDFKLDNR